MSKLSTTPVMRCTHCGRPIKLNYLATTKSDVNGELLLELMKGVAKSALCEYCNKQKLYFIKEGRMNEWNENRYLIVPK